MKATAGEVYTVYNQYLKRYTACQVAYIAPPDSVSKQPWAVILSLDWVGDAPLTAEELPHLRPLYKDFMYWSRDLHLLRVPLEVPPQYKLCLLYTSGNLQLSRGIGATLFLRLIQHFSHRIHDSRIAGQFFLYIEDKG